MKKRIIGLLSIILALSTAFSTSAVFAEEQNEDTAEENVVEEIITDPDDSEDEHVLDTDHSEIDTSVFSDENDPETDDDSLSENDLEQYEDVQTATESLEDIDEIMVSESDEDKNEQDESIAELLDEMTESEDTIYETSETAPAYLAEGEQNPDLPQLEPVTNIEWGKYYFNGYKPDGTYSPFSNELPGNLSFNIPELTQNKYEIYYYKDNEVLFVTDHPTYSQRPGEYHNEETLRIRNDLESGDYYVTVKTMGDNVNYRDSDVVKSDVWHYEKPDQEMTSDIDVTLEGTTARFTINGNIDYLYEFMMDIYFSETEGGEKHIVGSVLYSIPYLVDGTYYDGKQNTEWVSKIYDSCFETAGAGYYSVSIRLISRDITVVSNGQSSALSNESNITQIAKNMEQEFSDLLDKTESEGLSASEIREKAQALGSEELKIAMYADKTNTAVVQKMEELEKKIGGSEIEVKDDMKSVFNEDDMKVVGAALNTPENEEENIKLVLDKPQYEDVIPTMYNNTIAIKFSMGLENVENTDELKVPVKIVLPVPETINPEFLVILHYHVNGGKPEEIRPYIFEENGKKYATLILTSFSDFVMTVKGGNTAKNGLIQDDDGIWRLYKDGEIRENFTGMYPYGTSLFYLNKGVLDRSHEGIEYYQKNPYYVVKGQVTYNYTGLGEYKGSLHYFTKSVKDETFNGIAYYKGDPYFVVNGKVTYNYVGLGEYKGSLHYFTNSKKDTSFTGLSYYKNEPYYVLNGIVSYKYNGLGQYKTDWWYVVNSKVDKSFSGNYRWKSRDYAIKNGKVIK